MKKFKLSSNLDFKGSDYDYYFGTLSQIFAPLE